MPRPQLTLCPHRYLDILKTAELLYYYSHEVQYDPAVDSFKDEQKTKMYKTTLGVMRTLSKVYSILENIPKSASREIKKKLTDWKKIKDDLMSEDVLISLADTILYYDRC